MERGKTVFIHFPFSPFTHLPAYPFSKVLIPDHRVPCQGSEAGLHEDSCGKGEIYARTFLVRERRADRYPDL